MCIYLYKIMDHFYISSSSLKMCTYIYEKLNTHTLLQKRNLRDIRSVKFKRVITKSNSGPSDKGKFFSTKNYESHVVFLLSF